MKILIAEDESMSRRLLESALIKWGYEVVVTCDGGQAWDVLQASDAPQLAILDWMMPELDGREICQRVRANPETASIYIILLTANGEKGDIVAGLASGANDYVTKPFDREELQARVEVGARMIELQQSLKNRVQELQDALAQVKQLQGILPICSYCKHVRDDQNYWQQVESYISDHSDVQFSHSVCPDCFARVVQPQLDKFKSKVSAGEESPAISY